VLLAAALHAGWNAVVKTGLDRLLSMTLMMLCAGSIALAITPFVEFPRSEAWPYLLVSVLFQLGYSLCLVEAYATGDLAQVYPIARGTAPLLVSIAGALVLGEQLGAVAQTGVVLLVLGVGCMSWFGGRASRRLDARTLGFALGTSVFIALYTVCDAMGARINGSAHGYAVWLFVMCGPAMLPVLVIRRGVAGLRAMSPYWRSGVLGGAMSIGAYWIVVWAMTRSPIALVSALRESSVLFAALISVVFLREPLTGWRIGAALLIVSGVVLARVG
jgi:drug/metabolite transporter (DMT)-like permease